MHTTRRFKVSSSTIIRIVGQWRKAKAENKLVDYKNKRERACGRPSFLTKELKEIYRAIVREYAHSWRSLPDRRLQENLKRRGYVLSRLNRSYKTINIVPLLTDAHKVNRIKHVCSFFIKIGRQLKIKDFYIIGP